MRLFIRLTLSLHGTQVKYIDITTNDIKRYTMVNKTSRHTHISEVFPLIG